MCYSGDFAATVMRDEHGTLAVYKRNTFSFSLGYEMEFGIKR